MSGQTQGTAPPKQKREPWLPVPGPFSDEQLALLSEELDPHLAARMNPYGKETGSDKDVSYIEAHVVIEQANRIFGPGNFGYKVLKEDVILEDPEDLFGTALYRAWVETTVRGPHGVAEPVVDVGDCMMLVTKGKRRVLAQVSMASKGAVTDGFKRGCRHFGDQFGSSLYDKDSDIHKKIAAWDREQKVAERRAAADDRQEQARAAQEQRRAAAAPTPPAAAEPVPPEAATNGAGRQDTRTPAQKLAAGRQKVQHLASELGWSSVNAASWPALVKLATHYRVGDFPVSDRGLSENQKISALGLLCKGLQAELPAHTEETPAAPAPAGAAGH